MIATPPSDAPAVVCTHRDRQPVIFHPERPDDARWTLCSECASRFYQRRQGDQVRFS